MARFLFVGPDHGTTLGGREQLSRLHQFVLQGLLGESYQAILLPRAKLSGIKAVASALSGQIDGADPAAEAGILAHIERHGVTRVWLDGSNLGRLARAIKRRFPNVDVLTFFHNIEPRFFLGALRQHPGVRALGVVAATFVAERLAVRFSDRLIALNERDGDGLRRWHGRAATDLLPIAIPDSYTPSPKGAAVSSQRYLLFVGGSFYANKAGIAWYAREVAPAVSLETLVVGSGMEAQRASLEASPTIRVIGRVDDLGPFYRDALAVIAPIFDGSGMKTKVAEALMHGKFLIGSREAFTGYEQGSCQVGLRVETAAEWIAGIERVSANPPPSFDPVLRQIYEERYSRGALERGMAPILGLD